MKPDFTDEPFEPVSFSTVDCYGGFDGSPAGLDLTHPLIVARS